MFLCCVESLNSFRSSLDFLRIFKVAPKSDQSPCTIVQCFRPNFGKNEKERILHFYIFFLIHIHVLMLCRKFELIPIRFGFFYKFLKLLQNRTKVPVLIVQCFWPNFAKNEKERILHFYIFS